MGVVAWSSFFAHSIKMEPWSSAMATPPGMACTRSILVTSSLWLKFAALEVRGPFAKFALRETEFSLGCWFSICLEGEDCPGGVDAGGLQVDIFMLATKDFVSSTVGEVIDRLL